MKQFITTLALVLCISVSAQHSQTEPHIRSYNTVDISLWHTQDDVYKTVNTVTRDNVYSIFVYGTTDIMHLDATGKTTTYKLQGKLNTEKSGKPGQWTRGVYIAEGGKIEMIFLIYYDKIRIIFKAPPSDMLTLYNK